MSLLELVTYLDPRFKDDRRLDLEVILRRDIDELRANPSNEKTNSSEVEKVTKKKKKSALEELFEENDGDPYVVDVSTHELDLYNSQLKIPINEDPLTWWKN